MTILYAVFNFVGHSIKFSLLNTIYNTCAIHTQIKRQPSVARIFFARFFGIFLTSFNRIFLEAQISKNNKKLLTKPNTYDNPQINTNTTHTAPTSLHSLQNNHTLSLIPQSYRNTFWTTERRTHSSNYNVALYLIDHFSNPLLAIHTNKLLKNRTS